MSMSVSVSPWTVSMRRVGLCQMCVVAWHGSQAVCMVAECEVRSHFKPSRKRTQPVGCMSHV